MARIAVLVLVVAALLYAGCGDRSSGAARHHAAIRVAVASGADTDSELAHSFALARRTAGARSAPSPARIRGSASATQHIASGARSDAEVRRELRQMERYYAHRDKELDAASIGASLSGGLADPPPGAPEVITAVLAAGNAIARFPYVFGGGHGSFVDSAYDCSGSVSYALAAGGMLSAPATSGELAHWGEPGPGRWVTVFANPGHAFMVVAGLRFDTSGRSGVYGSRWQTAPRTVKGFAVRHWPGL